MMKAINIFASTIAIFTALSIPARAQGLAPDCMASFKVKSEKETINISWLLATGTSTALSCGAAESLREKLFVVGDSRIKQTELSGTPAAAQQQALTALSDLKKEIEQLSGNDVPGTLFSASGYLVSKYLLVSCLLTAEAAGGTCWGAAAAFFAANARFFQKLLNDEKSAISKQELLTEIAKIKPALTSVKPGQTDQAGARVRWMQTQTNLCRAIQKDCL